MVYFVQDRDSGLIKIGFTSKTILERVRGLMTYRGGERCTLRVLAIMGGGLGTEQTMHEKFASSHLGERHGMFLSEAFRPTIRLMAFIARLPVAPDAGLTITMPPMVARKGYAPHRSKRAA